MMLRFVRLGLYVRSKASPASLRIAQAAALSSRYIPRIRVNNSQLGTLLAGAATLAIMATSDAEAGIPDTEDLLNQPIMTVVLYQYNTCPFCNKVRAYLDIARVPYVVVEVNPLTKGQLSFSEYKKVPVAIVNGVQVTDSNTIIATLDSMLKNKGSYAACSRKVAHDTAVETKWKNWVDNTVLHTLSPNLYRTPREAWRSFDYLTERNFPKWSALPVTVIGSVAMYIVGKRLKSKYGIVDERKAMYDALNEYASNLPADAKFMGGQTPNLADVYLFGMLRAIEGCPTFRDAMMHSDPRVADWYSNMREYVGPSQLHHRVMEKPHLR